VGKPAILAVDDEPAVLNAVERDLRQKYGRDYRIIKSETGAAALDALKQLQKRDEVAALFVVDQRMPEMTGVQFLDAARQLFPDAKKVLLTAYADTEAAISSINRVGLDYYLMKPWDPPQENLYPVLDELLDEWKTHTQVAYDGIRVAGTLWSPASHTVKEFLTRQQIPFQWLDIETNPKARGMVEDRNAGALKLPTLFFPDGSVLVDPSMGELASKVGLATHAALPFYELVIVGAGPAGISAAVYASSDGIKCLLVERDAPGGQAGSSPKIENYLGFPMGISGADLTHRAITQARRLGAEIISAQAATRVRVQDQYRIITLEDGKEVSCRVLLLTPGASFHLLKMPGAAELNGKGIFYGAAHTEAVFYQGQDVLVVGGANSAAQGALFLSRYARRVTVIIRSAEPEASQYLVDELKQNGKIELLLNTDLVEVQGSDKFQSIVVKNHVTGETVTLPGAALFVFIGVSPQSQFLGGQVLCDDKGYIYTGADLMLDGKRPPHWPLARDPLPMETSVPGIFAAGDVRFGTNHRVASAVGEAAAATLIIKQFLKTL
jgi:thioredoxin reductase (NADPH)